MNSYRFDGRFILELAGDNAAHLESQTYYDEYDAPVEKWFGPIHGWCPAASPIYHPHCFYGSLNGGWLCEDGTLIPYDY